MSTFGGPGGRQIISKPIPPERGSFPLDHDAECQPIMKDYLRCLRSYKGTNSDECRQLSKSYLQCRMDRNLMAPDSMRNLGFGEENGDGGAQAASSTGDGVAVVPRSTKRSPDAKAGK